MELDELKSTWSEFERRLALSEARSDRALRGLTLQRTRAVLRRHGAGLIFELICGVIAVVLIGSFLADHIRVARFALPALALHLAALASTAAAIAQLVGTLRIDYAAPVLEIQRRVSHLRASQVRHTQWIFLLSPLIWTPLAIVAAQGFLELDLYATLGGTVLAVNLAVGLAVIPLGIFGARLCRDQLAHSPRLQRLADCIAGHSLDRALDQLRGIERFREDN